MDRLKKGNEYFTSLGVLEYISKDKEGMHFKVKGYRAKACIEDRKNVYAKIGFKYYKCKDKFIEPVMTQIREETALFLANQNVAKEEDKQTFFPYKNILREDMESIEFGTNDDPFKTKLYLIDEDDSPKGLVPEYFTTIEKAETFYKEFEKECTAKGMIGYTKEKDDLWKQELQIKKEELAKEIAALRETLKDCQIKSQKNLNNLTEKINEPRLTCFEDAKKWAKDLEAYLNFYDKLQEETLPNHTETQQAKIKEIIEEEKHKATSYFEERRIYYSQTSNAENDELEKKLTRLESQQKGMRAQILQKQNETTQHEWELFNNTEPKTKEEIDKQIETLEKLYQDMEKAIELADQYQADIEKEVEEALKNVSPGIYKAWALNEMHYTDNRW